MRVFLCYGDSDECWLCGGSASLGGTQEIVREHFCSDECADEYERTWPKR